MSAIYVAYHFTCHPLQPTSEILIAELGAVGFESFVENEQGLSAYIQKPDWDIDILKQVSILEMEGFDIQYTTEEIAQQNWNATWESNFDPIVVNEQCVVRAPFHEPFHVPYEIIIEPKMSFGTGHHETTFMMLKFILENDFEAKSVLDMGCGTAVLAILAEKRGAATLDAIDIDDWCVANSEENIAKNNCTKIRVQLGDAYLLVTPKKYDTIIANINRNILLQDLGKYAHSLKEEGQLYLSGFYREDLEMMIDGCNKNGLEFVEEKEKNNWIAAKFVHLNQ